MNKIYNIFLLLLCHISFSQTDSTAVERSNIQNYTPSKLLEKGKLDIKWFNGLYTETRSENQGVIANKPRENYFETSLEIFTGVSSRKILNIGLIVAYRSNTFAGQSAPSVFGFDNEIGKARSGFSHFAPSIKISPFKKIPNFSIQSSFFIPVFEKEKDENGYLANKSYIFQNRFFFDHTFVGSKFQYFTELSTRYFFGQKGSGYANNSLELAPSFFLSYFATKKSTIFGFLQHVQLIDLGNNFEQNYTASGIGAKYQLTNVLNIESIYSKFLRANDAGIGQSFNLGLRAIF